MVFSTKYLCQWTLNYIQHQQLMRDIIPFLNPTITGNCDDKVSLSSGQCKRDISLNFQAILMV